MTSTLKFLSPLIILPFILLQGSCTKDNQEVMTDIPVVEAYLQPGSQITVKVSRKSPTDENETLPARDLDHLVVTVCYAGSWYTLIPVGEGTYSDTTGLIPVVPDSAYLLKFNWDESVVTSSTLIPAKPAGVSLSDTSISMYQWDPDDPPAGQHPDPVTISFTPHLIPMTRGILATCYATLAGPADADTVRDDFQRFYADAPFVYVTDTDGR